MSHLFGIQDRFLFFRNVHVVIKDIFSILCLFDNLEWPLLLTLCIQDNFSSFFCHQIFFKNQLFQKKSFKNPKPNKKDTCV